MSGAGEDTGRALHQDLGLRGPYVGGVTFKAELQHSKKSKLKRDQGLLGDWLWFSLSTHSLECGKAGRGLGSVVGSPNLPKLGLATCKRNHRTPLLSPAFLLPHFPSLSLPPLFLSDTVLYRTEKYLNHLYPTSWNLKFGALERNKELRSRPRNQQAWGPRCHRLTWCHLAQPPNWRRVPPAHHSLYLVHLVLNSQSTLPSQSLG